MHASCELVRAQEGMPSMPCRFAHMDVVIAELDLMPSLSHTLLVQRENTLMYETVQCNKLLDYAAKHWADDEPQDGSVYA